MMSFWKFIKGILLRGETTDPTDNLAGSLWHNSVTNRLKGYFGGAVREFVTTDQTQTLSGKTIDGDDNVVQDLPLTSLKTVLADANKIIKRDASGIVVSGEVIPSGNLITDTSTNTLSNKTLDNSTVLTIKDVNLTIQDDSDTTKQVKFEASSLTTSTTRTITVPDANFTLTGTNTAQTIQNKTLDNTNTVTIKDTLLTIQDDGDATKQAKFQASGITAGQTRVMTIPDSDLTLVGTATTQILTNKTIDADLSTITNIENADIKAGAAINLNKLAATTVSRALVSDGSGFISPATTTSTEIGYVNGVTSAIQTQLDAKIAKSTATTKGDILVATASATVTRQSIGGDGQVLTADSAQTNGLKWSTPVTNPTTTKGDIAGYSTTQARIPVGSNGQILTADSSQTLGLKWAAPIANKNYIINGDMNISQRGSTFTTPASGSYTLDRYKWGSIGVGTGTFNQTAFSPTVSQVIASTGQAYTYTNCLDFSPVTVDTSIAAGDLYIVTQTIEGYNAANLAQNAFTVSFWFRSGAPNGSTYCIFASNSGSDRSCVQEFTITTASTWEYKTVTFPASPSAGTWNYTNGVGLKIGFCLAGGSTFQTTAGAWQTGDFYCTSNQYNSMQTTLNRVTITGLKVEAGTSASPFSTFGETVDAEIEACQRYYQKSYDIGVTPGTASVAGRKFATDIGETTSTTWGGGNLDYVVRMRTSPTLQIWDISGTLGKLRAYGTGNTSAPASNAGAAAYETGAQIFTTGASAIVAGSAYALSFYYAASAEL